MSVDSTAELLFKIGAESEDAEANIQRFRKVMGTDLSEMSAQFSDWADEVLGEITTVQAGMTAGFAVLAAGMVAAGAAVHEATKEYDEYVDSISRGMRLTGMTAEQLSAMHSAALKAGVGFETLVNGLVKFETSTVKAAEGGTVQLKAFNALGISQKDLIAGEKDLYPLLGKVMDGFHNTASAVEKAAMARDLFSRGGPELLNFLSKGSEYLRDNAEEAEKLGLILGNADVMAARDFKAAQKALQEQTESFNVELGKNTQGLRTWWATVEVTALKLMTRTANYTSNWNPFQNIIDTYRQAAAELKISRMKAEAAGDEDEKPQLDETAKKVEKIQQQFYGLSSVMEGLKGKIAAQGSEWDRVVEEVSHYHFEIDKAVEELKKLQAEGTITAESAARETAVLAQLPAAIARMQDQAWSAILEKQVIAQEKQVEVADEVHRELLDKLHVYDSADYNEQRAKLQKDMDAYRQSLENKTKLTTEEYAMLAQITADGLSKINKAQTDAFSKELATLTQHLEADLAATMSGEQRLYMEYQKSLEQYSDLELQKALKTAQTEAEAATIREFYARIQSQLLQKYQNDLNALRNSQGWQGVFGSKFGADLRNNQQLFREWSTSANQSLMMVQVSMENLKEMGEHAFEGLAQGMGAGIASSIVYSKSISQAMEAALASTLESIAAQCITYAIYAGGLGFLRLAEYDYPGAAAAFEAAAIFGTVGATAAIIGKEIAPAQDAAGSGAGAGGSAGGGGGSFGDQSGSGSGGGQQQPYVQVNIAGHVIGPNSGEMLADIINQAVYNNDATLYASHNASGVPIP
ncbi:MAG TPA: hypothetical protein VG273_11765 [Bryobacteraceae bacterium]|jgi:hypothetical protein|nr:hypothetical protein [Bryobacteraceae bacterium]